MLLAGRRRYDEEQARPGAVAALRSTCKGLLAAAQQHAHLDQVGALCCALLRCAAPSAWVPPCARLGWEESCSAGAGAVRQGGLGQLAMEAGTLGCAAVARTSCSRCCAALCCAVQAEKDTVAKECEAALKWLDEKEALQSSLRKVCAAQALPARLLPSLAACAAQLEGGGQALGKGGQWPARLWRGTKPRGPGSGRAGWHAPRYCGRSEPPHPVLTPGAVLSPPPLPRAD